jgi:AraC-like DNA-binding protein
MFHYQYILDDLINYSYGLESVTGFKMDGSQLVYPENVARGGSRFFKINDYISFQIADYTAQTKMIFERTPSQNDHIVINFQDFTFSKCKAHACCNEIIANNDCIGSVQCKSTRVEETVLIEPGIRVKLILVLLKEGWVDKVLLDDVNKEKFYQYLIRKDANIRKEYLTPEQRKLLYEIFDKSEGVKLQNLYNESRILNLLQTFLCEILEKDETEASLFLTSREDVDKIRLAESYIINKIEDPFPGVEYLAKISCMSRTKFIGLFNKVYGMSSYDYYQKERLSVAYNYLISGKFQITEVAEKIGYVSNNNFTAAFKKKYGILPKELVNNVKSN